jgi:transposase-like protein
MKTKPDTEKHGSNLTPQQMTAVDLLAAGATVTAVAEQVNCARQTVSEWLNQNPAFQAGLNQRRAELWAEQSDPLRGLLPKALDTVESALEEGGAEGLKAALAIIRAARIELAPSGPVDIEEIETMEAERKSALIFRQVSASFGRQ